MGLEQYANRVYAFSSSLILILKQAIDDQKFCAAIFEAIEGHMAIFKAHAGHVHLCREVYIQIDRLIDREKPPEVSCRAGCAFCCAQFVAVSRTEATHLYGVAKAKGIVLDREHLARQSVTKEEDWHRLPMASQPCVFLDTATRQCRVYEERPLACRKYFVVGDPKMCDINTNRTQLQPVWYQLDAELMSTAWMTVDGCESLSTLLLQEMDHETRPQL